MQDTTSNVRPSIAEIVLIGTLLVFFALAVFMRF
jgi:hypothetical protein